MDQPRSFRLPPRLVKRISEDAAEYGTTVTALVTSLLDEGTKIRRFPRIEYRPGPAGRRAALTDGPDVWEVVGRIRELRGGEAVRIATLLEETALTEEQVRRALAFYAAYPDEIDARLDLEEQALREHEAEEARLRELYDR